MHGYYSVEDGDHFVSCLLLVDAHMRKKHKDATDIRWIVIGLHDALYSALIEKLTRTDGFGIFNQAFEKKVTEFYENGGDCESPAFAELSEASFTQNTASLKWLLKRADLPSGAEICDQSIYEQSRPTKGVSWLKEMRDHHAHPRPMTQSIEEELLTIAFEDTLSVIREVINISGQRHVPYDAKEVQILLDSIEFYLERWIADFQN